VHFIEQWRIDDLVTLAMKVAHIVRAHPETAQLAIDTVGMGQGVYDILDKQGFANILQPVNAGASAFVPHKFLNLRAEMWFNMRAAINEGIDLPKNESLLSDLVGLEYDYDAKQRLLLEKKADMKKRGLSSPDTADALAMTYAFPLGLNEKKFERSMQMGAVDNDFAHSYF
jgi:hypothetical protein